MISSFYRAFPKNTVENKLSSKLVKMLNKDLPKGLTYEFDKKRNQYVIKPGIKPETLQCELAKEEYNKLPNGVEKNAENLLEWAYRTQTPVQAYIETAQIKGEKIEFKKLFEDPLNPARSNNSTQCYLYPSEFPKVPTLNLRTVDGLELSVDFKRVAYESMSEIKIENTNYLGLKIILFFDGKVGKGSIGLNVKNAASSKEALLDSKIYLSYAQNKLYLDDVLLKCSKESHIDEMLLQKQIHFWEVITVLENKLRVKIDPSKGFTDQEYILVSQLERSLIKGEDEVYSEPYKSFHMKLDEETFIRVKDTYLNKGGKGALVSRELKEEEIAGSKIKYYKVSVLVGFKVDDIDYQKDGENYSCEMYISNIGEKQYKLIVNRATSERQAKQIEKKILKKYG